MFISLFRNLDLSVARKIVLIQDSLIQDNKLTIAIFPNMNTIPHKKYSYALLTITPAPQGKFVSIYSHLALFYFIGKYSSI